MPRPPLDLASTSLRERVATALLGYCAVVLIVAFFLLFKGDLAFTVTATALSGVFVDPVLVALAVGAVLLATRPGPGPGPAGPSPHARALTLAGVGVLGVMAGIGVLTFLSALGANDNAVRFGGLGGVPLAGKFSGTLLMLAGLGIVVAALVYALSVLRQLPVAASSGAVPAPGSPPAQPAPEPMPTPVPGPTPVPSPGPVPSPDPVPAPDPVPTPDPVPDPDPEPVSWRAPSAGPSGVDVPTAAWSPVDDDRASSPEPAGSPKVTAEEPAEYAEPVDEPGGYTWVQPPGAGDADGAAPDAEAAGTAHPDDGDDDRPIWQPGP